MSSRVMEFLSGQSRPDHGELAKLALSLRLHQTIRFVNLKIEEMMSLRLATLESTALRVHMIPSEAQSQSQFELAVDRCPSWEMVGLLRFFNGLYHGEGTFEWPDKAGDSHSC